MNARSRKIVDSTAEILNRHVITGDSAGVLLAGDHGKDVLGLVNELLREVAEGGSLVSAVESSGTLLGFVPRTSIPLLDVGGDRSNGVEKPSTGPDDE